MDTLRPQLIVAGLRTVDIDRFIATLDSRTDEQILDYIERVTNLTLRGGAYHGFMGIYGLKPPEWWVNMANLGETDLREHKLLRAEAKKLKHAWRQLHHGQAKPIAESDTTQGSAEGVSVRPEG